MKTWRCLGCDEPFEYDPGRVHEIDGRLCGQVVVEESFSTRCRFEFKSAPCGYRGELEDCDKTFRACIERDNFVRFGGWLDLPQGGSPAEALRSAESKLPIRIRLSLWFLAASIHLMDRLGRYFELPMPAGPRDRYGHTFLPGFSRPMDFKCRDCGGWDSELPGGQRCQGRS